MSNAEITTTRWGKVLAWWLLDPRIDADRFCVMAALATYADEDGFCEPSQATLARRLKRSRPWGNRVIADLVKDGFLDKTARIRRNGGTTSCRYRLAQTPLDFRGADVTTETSLCHANDAPRHGHDRSQLEPEQIQTTQPAMRAAPISDPANSDTSVGPVPADWVPSADTVAKARAVFPVADTLSHSAMFVARCRSKGYRYRPETLDDTWLAWFIEDQRRDTARRVRDPRVRPVMLGKQGVSAARFDAWTVSATSPRLSSVTWS